MSEIRTNLLKSERGDASPSAPFGLRVSGVCTATTFKGNLTGAASQLATDATGANLTLSGNLGVAGTITYEDVARVDATGISTFREGFGVGPLAGIALTAYKDGSIRTSGVVTATSYYGSGANLTGISAGAGGNTPLDLNDGVKANFGTDDDLRIYAGSGNSFIQHQDTAAGDLYIDAEASNVYIRSGDGGTGAQDAIVCQSNSKIQFKHAGTTMFETSTDGLKITTAGKGVDFSITGNPNNGTVTSELLDYYEEGTFTPVIDTASGSVGAYSYQIGKYTRVGNLVTCHFYVQAAKGTGDGNTKITGLPYTSMNMGSGGATGEQFVGQYLYYAPGALTGQGHGKDLVATLGAVQNNSTEFKLYVLPDDNENLAPYQLDWGVCSNSLYLRLIHTFTYFCA